MKLRTIAFVCCVVSGAFIGVAANAGEKLNVKTGHWETTLITKTQGNIIPKATLDKLAPEQRAKLEQALAARASGKAAPRISQTCVTEEDLEKGISGGEPNADCKKTIVSQTATHQEMTLSCSRSGVSTTGHMTVDAVSNESVKGVMELTVGEGKVLADFSGKWIGPSCPASAD